MKEEGMSDLFTWSSVSARIRQIDEEIERRWADYELDSEAADVGLKPNPRARLDVLFEERGQLIKRQKEIERKI